MKNLFVLLGVLLFVASCGHKSPHPTKPGLVFSSITTNSSNPNILNLGDTSGKKEVVLKFSYTVNLSKVPSNGVVLKTAFMRDVIGNDDSLRAQEQDLPVFPTDSKAEDVEDGTLQIVINAKKWQGRKPAGSVDSLRYKVALKDYADRLSDSVETGTLLIQY
jgi:hypothetical protein